jgi:molybdenum cofactor synthesis domain-containing protein
MTPARVGALAALGQVFADVFERPRVALISTGDEIIEPGLPLTPGRIHDVNRFTLPPLVRTHGGRPESHPAVADSREALREALDRAGGADLVVFSGGSSVGDRDLLIDAVGERGQVLFHGIAVKPGKPTLLARVGEQLVLGMPGNPTSCLSNAYILLVPLLRAIARLPEHVAETRVVRLSDDISSPRGRHQFYPVRVEGESAVPVFRGSGEITSLSQADGYIEVSAETERVIAGTMVTVKLFQ